MACKRHWGFPIVMTVIVVYACLMSVLRMNAVAQPAAVQLTSDVCVVIDAGHGGEDGGAVSAGGVRESDINLSVALRVRDLLALCGVCPRMIRTEDTAVYSDGCAGIAEKKTSDLKNRAQMVNETPGALLLSIHQNYFPEGQYHGAQVFFAETAGSAHLADALQSALRAALDPQNHRQSKRAQGVYLMEHIRCTAVLVECGFLSNAAETDRLQQPDYQKKLTAAICGALTQYLSEEGADDEV